MATAICRFCGDDYSMRRFDLGYISCLECGDKQAEKEKAFKAKCVTVAYNKGPMMFITNKDQVKGIFKSGDYK